MPKRAFAMCVFGSTAALGWAAACSSGGTMSAPDAGNGGGSSGGPVDAAATHFPPGIDAGPGLLVDDMTAMVGTQISLQVPDGGTPGSYYTYSDYPFAPSLVEGTSQLIDVPVSSAATNPDGTQVKGELCFEGNVVGFAGLGMSLEYGPKIDPMADAACPPPGQSPPLPFDASHYSGVSFYIRIEPGDGSPLPSIHFGVPDTQTADPCAVPKAACGMGDAGCYDDFGADVTPLTPGVWTKASFKWKELSQGNWGAQFPVGGLRTDQLIGMKWQANGPPSVDGAAGAAFKFCISDIYFTP